MKTYQEMIHDLQGFWMQHGCVIVQPYNSEVGAGTFNPNTFLRCLGPEPWNVAYVEPSRRPKDGRYGENPNRVHQFLQYQVLLKPAPANVQDLYLESLRAIGFSPEDHDIRFVEDDWESPTLGAAGLGWEVWLDGMEVTQFTYFQQAGGIELDLVSCEITYGLLRLAMFLQRCDHVMNLNWGAGLTWGEINGQYEKEFSEFNFKAASTELYFQWFEQREKEAEELLKAGLVMPGYDAVCKCSHYFNLLEARGAISVTERTGYIGRVRKLARLAAKAYVQKREEMGFPLLKESTVGES